MSLLSLNLAVPPPAAGETRGNPLENPAVPLSAPSALLVDVFTGGANASGVAVTEQTSMQLATVFTCVSKLSRDISTLPMIVYEHKGKERAPAVDSDLYDLITVRPNPEMSAPTFWGVWYGCAVLTGNGYAQIQRDGTRPVALWPLNPRTVRPKRTALNDLYYEVIGPTGTRNVKPEDMLHLRGFSLDGWLGLSPIMAARVTIGTAVAAENYGAGFFGRGSRPSGILTGPELKAGQTDKLDQAKASWEAANAGGNQGKTAVLPNGWSWTAVGVTPEDAQFLETQQYTRAQIAALFGLLPHQVGDTSRLSNSNHESAALEYATFTLRPWLVNGESEVQHKLMPRIGRKANQYSVAHDLTELVRGDFKTQMDGLAIGRQWGGITINEFRRRIGLNPVGKEGDVLIVPLNMVSADSVLTGGDAAARTDGAGSAGDGEDDDSADGGGNDDTLPGVNEPIPKGNGGRNQRMLVDRMATVYGPLIADACGRLAKRTKRDAEAVAQIFGPVIETIAAEALRQAVQAFRIDEQADLGTERILRDYRKAVEKRAVDWQLDKLGSELLDAEAARTIRAIVLPIFREAGGHVALAA